MNQLVENIKVLGRDLKLLYVEDNKGLRDNMSSLLTKFFPYVEYAENGDVGYELYRTHAADIVLSDIKMPGMSGFDLAKAIKADNEDVRIIFLTAFDEKEYLYEAIKIGAFRYLSKPTKVPLLISALYDAALSIHNQRHKQIFEKQLNDIFNYQNNLLIMIKERESLLVNRQFLDFFGVNTLEEFLRKYRGIDELLLEHQGFLYSTSESFWLDKALLNPGKLFHTKILNPDGEVRHLILKLRLIPDQEGYAILSLDDITDLNLLMIFDSKASKNDQMLKENTAVLKLMKVVSDNSSEVKLHNFYRGLTIVNSAVLIKIEGNEVVLKTTYSQLKAIKLTNNIIITSELFPYSVLCKTIKSIDYDAQIVIFSDAKFMETSADKREYIRLEPDEARHTATLFYRDIKYFGKTSIMDISIRSVKIEMDALPAGLAVGEIVKIAIVLETDKQPLNLFISSSIFRIDSFSRNYHLVLLFELSSSNLDKLKEYLAKRQLELIREFKAI